MRHVIRRLAVTLAVGALLLGASATGVSGSRSGAAAALAALAGPAWVFPSRMPEVGAGGMQGGIWPITHGDLRYRMLILTFVVIIVLTWEK